MRIIRVEHGGTSYYGILEDGLVSVFTSSRGTWNPYRFPKRRCFRW